MYICLHVTAPPSLSLVVVHVLCIVHHILIGQCTNGEWSTLRCKGNTRPLSVFQIKADARKKYSKMPKKTMMAMLTPICK